MLKKLESNDQSSDYQVYFSKNKKGEPMKSTTIAIRGSKGRIIGLMCVNLYLGTPIINYISEMLPRENAVFAPETFADNAVTAIQQKLQEAKNQVYSDTTILPSMRNKEIIRILYNAQMFELKNAVENVAAELEISVNTVYFHLRNLAKGH